jgi:predicted metal-dependent peptidase
MEVLDSDDLGLQQDWQITAQNAKDFSKAFGVLPGNYEEIIAEAWKATSYSDKLIAMIKQYMYAQAKNDYNMNIPNKKFLYFGMHTPSMLSYELDNVVYVIDTSGSIDQKQMELTLKKLKTCMVTLKATGYIMQVDTKVQSVIEFDNVTCPNTFPVKGRGGTSFIPAFTYLLENHITPSVLVYFTDLEGHTYPLKNPGFPVIWAWNSPHEKPEDCYIGNRPFGDIVHVNRNF